MERENSFWAQTYKVPTIPGAIVLFLIIAFACLTFTRGADMAFSDAPEAKYMLVQNSLLNPPLWGVGLMAGSAFLLLSLVLRLQWLVWAGHVHLCALYVGFSIMVGQSVYFLGGDGVRAVVPFVGGAIWHGLFVILSRPFGTRRERV